MMVLYDMMASSPRCPVVNLFLKLFIKRRPFLRKKIILIFHSKIFKIVQGIKPLPPGGELAPTCRGGWGEAV